MRRSTNLIQRAGRWYFNRVFPRELWPALGKVPFRVSLQTDSLEIALRRRPHAELEYFAKIDLGRSKPEADNLKNLNAGQSTGCQVHRFKDALGSRTKVIDDAVIPGCGIDVRIVDVNGSNVYSRHASSQNELYIARSIVNRFIESAWFADENKFKANKVDQHMLPTDGRELVIQETERLLREYFVRNGNPIFAEASENSEKLPLRNLNDLIEAHKADKVAKRSQSTQAAYGPVWRLLRQTLGAQRSLTEIGREEGRQLFETAKALPRGIGKNPALRGLTVPQAVEKGRLLGMPVIAPKTVNGVYIGLMKTIFTWAVREQWMRSNPLAGLSVEELVAEADKRDPFTLAQLNTIFSREPWKPRDEAPKDKPLHFWGPLIALFHGMRRGEIAQLDATSVKIVNGQWVILIRGGDCKRLKTVNARRMLPVHPELIRIGLLAFAKRQRDANEIKLFPGETPNANGQWGDGFSDWFSRLIQKEDFEGARLGMHSFRHNWQDRAREAGLHGTAIGQELAGRAKGGNTSNNYGSGFSTQTLAVASASINYPGLDLSHLYVT